MHKKHSQTTEGEAKAKPKVIKLGLDLHVRQVTECRQLDGSTPKPAQQWGPWKLLDQIKDWVKAGIKVYSCYEAGVCGYCVLGSTTANVQTPGQSGTLCLPLRIRGSRK